MTNEIPELPDWIKALIESAREEGYDKGREDGERWTKENILARVQGYCQ